MNNNELKYIQSFAHKKHWDQESVFIVEGPKLMKEVLESDWTIEKIYATEDWLQSQKTIMLPVEQVDEIVLARISQFKTANQVLALVKKKEHQKSIQFDKELTLVLDGIQDPGNLGTIIRTADWFGVHQIIVSDDTAGLYNPKVIQSSMGSFLRVQVASYHLESVLASSKLPVYGAVLNGEPYATNKIQAPSFLIIGNESKGIRAPLLPYITKPITIPHFGEAESLNAAVAAGILLSSWKS
ncbi:MAG: RNA methyltransferase [Bacteroidetes bacterium]|nr:RNA methyltransferase [Bacteroidota bacterium]